MHLCQLLPPFEYYSPVAGGAIATVAMQQARHLERRGHRVSIIARTKGDPTYDTGRIVPIHVPTRQTLSFLRRRASGLSRRLRGWDWPYYEYYLSRFRRALVGLCAKPDVVIVHNDLVSPAHVRQVLPDAKIIVWLHNEVRTARRHLRRAFEAADHFIAVSDYIRHWTAREHGLEPDRLTTILNGVDLDAFFPRPSFLSPRGPGEPLRVLFVGRLDPNKGPDLAADAVASLRAEGLAVSLTVAGAVWFHGNEKQDSDPFFVRLKEKLTNAAATYTGYLTRDRVPALVRDHDVVCLLARSNDPCPLVTFEAMASGCAVLASNRGGLPQACDGAAVLVDPDDFAAVADALRMLAVEPQRLADWKRRALARARRADWSVCVDRFERVLDRLGVPCRAD